MRKWRTLLDLALVVLSAISLATMFFASEDSFARHYLCLIACMRSEHATALNKILYDIAAAFLVSTIFYFLVVWSPDLLKRRRMKRVLHAQYKSFKTGCIEILLGLADGSYDSQLPEKLIPQSAFRDYFNDERWYAVANKLEAEGYWIEKLVNRMEVLRGDVLFVLNNTDIADDQSYEFFHRLSSVIYTRKNVDPEYDGVKSLCRFLWNVFSGWSFVDGYAKSDIIEDMIKAI
jgi:hypothetical protein